MTWREDVEALRDWHTAGSRRRWKTSCWHRAPQEVQDALARLEARLEGLDEIPGTPPYRIAGAPPGIISADDWDATDEVLAFLDALARAEGER